MMDSTFQEISKEDALQRYLEGQDIQVLRPTQSGRLAMWSMNELFQGSRFFIESTNQKVNLEPPKEVKDDTGSVHLQDLHEPVNDSSITTNNELLKQIEGSEMTEHGDVYVKTQDNERKKRVRIDIGKLKSLKDAGWRRKDIADELHCSLQSVNKYWNKI